MSQTPYRFLGDIPKADDDNLLKIYCRLKPLNGSDPCFVTSEPTQICSYPPPSSNCNKQMQFSFKHVFSPEATQKDVFDEVALPLVEKVLQGQNSLLFAYGNTGSGKTYTMKGTLKESGIMPRCLDVIFNSVTPKLAKKHVFKSDKFNGFEIQSEKEASTDSHRAFLKQIGNAKGNRAKLVRKHNSDPDLASRFIDPTQILMVSNKNKFAVFVTFVEIYNNSVYDLLDDSLEDLHKPPQAKIIREDSKKNMFVHGVTEIEVSSTDEACEIFYKGLKKRRVAETLLNTNSSRSHSIFTIRVVQGDLSGLNIIKNRGNKIPTIIGQLSLIDLAGSERCNRTQNTGKNLVEAGNINNSLMTLRLCFDAIKENQKGGGRIVPYRDSRLTTLCKNFFEGDGNISMIICLNPHKDDFDETLHILKFAECSHEIHISVPLAKQIEETNRYRQLQNINRLQILEDKWNTILNGQGNDVEDFEQNLPEIVFAESTDSDELMGICSAISDVCQFIDSELEAMNSRNCERICLDNMEIYKAFFKTSMKCDALKHEIEMAGKTLERENNTLKRKLAESNDNVKKLRRELMEKEKMVLKTKAEKEREKEKMQLKKNVYKEKYNSELEKLKRQRTELEMENINRGDKLARVQRVLSDEIISTSSTPSVASCRAKFEKIATPSSIVSTPRVPYSELRHTARRGNIAVSNRRHRRSRSAGDVWVEHKPAMPVPLNTVLQPSLPKRRSISKLTDAKQVTQGVSKYCLMTQTQDSDGDLETRLYKGDVIPTSGGGAQVLFNDVEVLKQVSPEANPKTVPRERINDPEPSCSYAIEGHKGRQHRMK